jgi:hypothetical protein
MLAGQHTWKTAVATAIPKPNIAREPADFQGSQQPLGVLAGRVVGRVSSQPRG